MTRQDWKEDVLALASELFSTRACSGRERFPDLWGPMLLDGLPHHQAGLQSRGSSRSLCLPQGFERMDPARHNAPHEVASRPGVGCLRCSVLGAREIGAWEGAVPIVQSG